MNLHTLRIFMTVAQHESVTEAAKQLLISQPAVTAQIRKLESELGVKLISSKGRGIELTEEGQFLYAEGIRLFQLEQHIDHKFQHFLQRQEQLSIASSYIPMNYILPNVISQYMQQYPNTQMKVSMGNVQSVEQQVLHFEADIGFVVQSNIGHKDLHFDKVMDVPFWFVVSPSHHLANQTVAIEDTVNEPFIYRERGSSTLDLLEAVYYTNNCPLPYFGLQMQGLHESLKVVEAGYGMTLAPAFSVEAHIQQGRLARVVVEGVSIEQSLFICTRKLETPHPFYEFVKQSL